MKEAVDFFEPWHKRVKESWLFDESVAGLFKAMPCDLKIGLGERLVTLWTEAIWYPEGAMIQADKHLASQEIPELGTERGKGY